MRTVIYPGSFDPITNGHLDVACRAAKLFDRVVVAVAINDSKRPLFSLKERAALVARAVADLQNVEVDTFEGLLVDYVEKQSAQAVLRGLRAVSDFEFEFQLALMNRKLSDRFETIFMMPKDIYTFLSSSMLKEIPPALAEPAEPAGRDLRLRTGGCAGRPAVQHFATASGLAQRGRVRGSQAWQVGILRPS